MVKPLDTGYLKDGRKVVVVSVINSEQHVVREVFVAQDDEEVPGGEQFVVGAIFPEPLESDLERRNKKAKASLERLGKTCDAITREIDEKRKELRALSEIFRSSKKLAEALPRADLSLVADVFAGNIKYLVMDEYSLSEPVLFSEKMQCKAFKGEIRLMSMFGGSNGDLAYKIGQYRDDSGSWSTVVPCRSLKEAKSCLKRLAEKRIEANRLSKEEYDMCLRLRIAFSDAAKATFWEHRAARIKSGINRNEDDLKKKEGRRQQLSKDLAKAEKMREKFALKSEQQGGDHF